jgi:formamidopyrimidine-DNA glycosylase
MFTITQAEIDHIITRSRAPVKGVLMDQSRIAGLGNLLVDEVLWRAGIDPARPARDLDRNERRRVHRAISRTVRMTLERGGSHTGDHMPQRFPGGVCPKDGTPYERRTVAGRTTFSCPKHQY